MVSDGPSISVEMTTFDVSLVYRFRPMMDCFRPMMDWFGT